MTPAGIQAEIRKLAREAYERRKAAYASPPEWRDVAPAEFPQLDRGFYERVSQDFIAAGFHWIGDKENVALSRAYPEQQTFVRWFLGEAGTINASAWHVRPLARARFEALLHGDGRASVRGVSLCTEFADGTFLLTDNVKGQDTGIAVPGIDVQRLGQQAPPASLLKLHRAATADRLAGGARAAPAADPDAVLASARRLHDRTAEHLARTGYFNVAHELSCWREHVSPDVCRLLVAELAALQAAGQQ